MHNFREILIAVICAFIASSGFWAWMMKKSEWKDAKTELLLGLAHDRIVDLGMKYINRGWITSDEFENLHDYLYVPYEKSGGNGSAKRIMDAVRQIKIMPPNYKGENTNE